MHTRCHRDFPGGPVVKTPPSNAGGTGSIPGPGTNIPHAMWYGQKLKKQTINKQGATKKDP